MKTALVRIGNSRGVRIPKPFLDQVGLAAEVDLDVEEDRIVIRSHRTARAGWAQAFASAAGKSKDPDLLPGGLTTWDRKEWAWR